MGRLALRGVHHHTARHDPADAQHDLGPERQPSTHPAVLGKPLARPVHDQVRPGPARVDGTSVRLSQGPERRSRHQVERPLVEVRDLLLVGDDDRTADVVAQRLVRLDAAGTHGPAVGEGDQGRYVPVVDRAKLEQPVHAPEPPRGLAAAEPAVGVAHRPQPVAGAPPRLDHDLVELLAEQGLDREAADGQQPAHRRLARGGTSRGGFTVVGGPGCLSGRRRGPPRRSASRPA